jgi:hypothetical protein
MPTTTRYHYNSFIIKTLHFYWYESGLSKKEYNWKKGYHVIIRAKEKVKDYNKDCDKCNYGSSFKVEFYSMVSIILLSVNLNYILILRF